MAENAFRQSLLSSSGNVGVFFSNPLVGSITTLALIMLVWPAVQAIMGRIKGTKAA
jgi:putative tricarboxylic transport membrane protein